MPVWISVLLLWIAFAGSHLVLSSMPVRRPLTERLGERGFQGLYSVVALATFIPLAIIYFNHRHAGPILWSLRFVPAVRWLAIGLAAVAFALLVLSFMQPSPTGMTPGAAKRSRGVTRITRHPLFIAIGLWAVSHLLVNGSLADVVFFGGFVAFGVIGAAHQDARKRVAEGGALAEFYDETSLLPFAAIGAGRNRLVLAEIPWTGVVIGIVVAALIYIAHGPLFGV